MQSELLNCCICCFEFNRDTNIPKMLVCGHTICSCCLDGIFRKYKAPTCPLDRVAIPMPPQRTSEGLPTNIILLQLLEERDKISYDACISHREQNTLVCTIDKCKICHYCANYGSHMNHPTRTVQEFQSEADTKREKLEAQVKEFNSLPQMTDKLLDETRNPLLMATRHQMNKLREIMKAKEERIRLEIGLFFAQQRAAVDSKIEGVLAHREENPDVRVQDCLDRGDEQRLIISTVKEQNQKFSQHITNLEKSFNTIVHQFNPTNSNHQQVGGENGEKLFYKFSKVKDVLRFKNQDNYLVISPREESKEREAELLEFDFSNTRRIKLDFTKVKPSEQSLQAMFYVWQDIGEIVSLKLDFSKNKLTEQELYAFYTQNFWATEQLQEFELNLEECKVGTENIIKIISETMLKTLNVRTMKFNLSDTGLNEKSVEAFTALILPLLLGVNNFKLDLSANQIGDTCLIKFCLGLQQVSRRMTSFHLNTSQTNITDKFVGVFTKILPAFSVVEEFFFGVHITQVTENSIQPLCVALKTIAPKLKSFSLGICINSSLTDYSVETFANSTLPSMSNLTERFSIGLNGKGITDAGIVNLFTKMQYRMTNVTNLELQLWYTSITNNIFEVFSKFVTPSLFSLKHLTLILRGNKISDQGVCFFFEDVKKIMKNLRSIKLDFSKTAITDKALETFNKTISPLTADLEVFDLNLATTSITDKQIIELATSMKTYTKNLKTFTLILTSTKVTNSSIEVLIEYLLSIMPSLTSVKVDLEHTNVNNYLKTGINKLQEDVKK